MKEKNIFIIRWYGPFSGYEELKDWEFKRKDLFYLYIFQGKRHGKIKYKYYCGMTFDRKHTVACVANRMHDADHHIHIFEEERPETISIWIGTFANLSRPKISDVRLCEKMLTSELTNIELDINEHENRINKRPPHENVFIINEWFDINKVDDDGDYYDYESSCKDIIPNKVPDVMCYYADDKALYSARKLKFITCLNNSSK